MRSVGMWAVYILFSEKLSLTFTFSLQLSRLGVSTSAVSSSIIQRSNVAFGKTPRWHFQKPRLFKPMLSAKIAASLHFKSLRWANSANLRMVPFAMRINAPNKLDQQAAQIIGLTRIPSLSKTVKSNRSRVSRV